MICDFITYYYYYTIVIFSRFLSVSFFWNVLSPYPNGTVSHFPIHSFVSFLLFRKPFLPPSYNFPSLSFIDNILPLYFLLKRLFSFKNGGSILESWLSHFLCKWWCHVMSFTLLLCVFPCYTHTSSPPNVIYFPPFSTLSDYLVRSSATGTTLT